MDDTVRLLIRFVSRGFYGKPYVLILDAILLHSVLSEDDLSHLLGIQRKELRALCNKLVDDRLLTMHVQKEEGPQFRPISRTYFYIHHTEAIDSIKWKIHSVVQGIKDEMHATNTPQGYICPVCKTKYSQLDAIALLNYEKNEFLCSLCNEELIEDDSGKIAKENQIKYSKLMDQLEPVINYLKKIDEHPIAENNFETSLSRVIPVQATSNASYAVSNFKSKKMFNRDSYLNNSNSMRAGSRSQATLHVNITSTKDDNLQKEKQALEAEEKKKQNALPTWHEESTIGKGLGKFDKDDEGDIDITNDENAENKNGEQQGQSTDEQNNDPTTNVKTEGVDPTAPSQIDNDVTSTTTQATPAEAEDKEAQDALAAYYAQLAARDNDDNDDEDEEEEDDDEEEEEFDDVQFEDIGNSQDPNGNDNENTTNKDAKAEDLVVEELEFGESDEE
ncbi:General transcription factor IIE subunit 1 [Wickerhamomyces ciferrii]|uniref:General transcription factor IIE subunit 1 n=1 Tax=Wickerhamomyces ciferrii (strain ATCC 14091 / BCRC 22168 / CBS 111 / JCM 3599 / NBRC 0793 / NRRL Y-1031 F-60-10) TaxID=1206466 RepID=K0KT53_WICCF|nr:General transcription factor IIE subunit 1 [Wickerhamomyces ciferrii]CCH46326.1 General transcription factor IIE subunit 1 [Wickerhamomyces ciferrii]